MPITIHKKDQFFMVACEQSMHSFLCIGVIHNNNMIPLIEVGKAIPFDKRHRYPNSINGIAMLCEALFKCLDSEILNERRLIDGKKDGVSHNINYIACEITFENYLQLLNALRYINPKIQAHFPISSNNTTLTLDYQQVSSMNASEEKHNPDIAHVEQVERLRTTGNTLTLQNNCRGAVIDLTYLTRSLPPSPLLSNRFYKSFPCKTSIQDGRFTDKLYILPAPPSAFSLDKNKEFVITQLYNKLEKIIVDHPEMTETTFDQFESLKTLYSKEAGKPNQTLQALIEGLKVWHTNHPGYLTNTTHSFYCCRSKRVNIVSEIEEKFGAPGFKKLFDRVC